MNMDWTILNWIQQNLRNDVLDTLMPWITFLGNAGWIWILSAIVFMVRPKTRKTGCILLITLIVGLLLGELFLKNLVARPRPCTINTDIELLIPRPKEYSFPSGHTLSSIASATVLSLSYRKWARFVIPLAVMIAFSRLYLYVHFPSDVLAGALLGIVIGYWTYKTLDKRLSFTS